MNAFDYWQLFLETGAPEVYMMYAGALKAEENQPGAGSTKQRRSNTTKPTTTKRTNQHQDGATHRRNNEPETTRRGNTPGATPGGPQNSGPTKTHQNHPKKKHTSNQTHTSTKQQHTQQTTKPGRHKPHTTRSQKTRHHRGNRGRKYSKTDSTTSKRGEEAHRNTRYNRREGANVTHTTAEVAQHSGTQLQKRGGDAKQHKQQQINCKTHSKNTENTMIKQTFRTEIFANKEIEKDRNGIR
mgnify:CR=1 FL=1